MGSFSVAQRAVKAVEDEWFFYLFSAAFVLILSNACGRFATSLASPALTLAVGVIVAVVIFLRPEIGLSLFIASIFFEECWLVAGSITIAKVIGLVTLIAWLVRFPFLANRRLILPIQAWLTALLLAFGLLSMVWAPDDQVVIRRVIMGAGLLGAFIVIVNLVDSPAKLRRISYVVAMAGLASALLALDTYFFGEPFSDVLQRARIVPAQIPGMFAASLIPVFALFSRGVTRQQGPLHTTVWSFGHLIVTVAILLSLSRGVMIAIAAVLVLTLILARHPKQRVLLALLALVEIAIVRFVGSGFSERAVSVVTAADRGAGRIDVWVAVLRVIATYPIQGVGLSNFPVVFFDYYSQPAGLQRVVTAAKTPHSIYLGMLAELGIIGFLVFAGIIGTSVVSAIRARFDSYHKAKDRYLRFASEVWLLSLVGFLVEGLFQDLFYRKWFWLGLGLVEVVRRLSSQGDDV